MRTGKLESFVCKIIHSNLVVIMQVQVEQGVDAVIVDSVLAIRKGLTAAVTEDPVIGSKIHDMHIPAGVEQIAVAKKEVAKAVAIAS